MKVGDSLKISKNFDNACAYDGLTDELGHCGDHKAHQVGGDVSLGGQYDFGNGFTMGAGIAGEGSGLVTKEDSSAYGVNAAYSGCLLYTSPSPRDLSTSRMPSSA